MNLATASVPGSPAIIDFVYPVLSAATVLLLAFIARTIAKLFKKFKTEHEWLMTTVATNTAAIKTMLEQRDRQDKRDRQDRRRPNLAGVVDRHHPPADIERQHHQQADQDHE